MLKIEHSVIIIDFLLYMLDQVVFKNFVRFSIGVLKIIEASNLESYINFENYIKYYCFNLYREIYNFCKEVGCYR